MSLPSFFTLSDRCKRTISSLTEEVIMKLEYFSLTGSPYRFIGFSRFGNGKNISEEDWTRTVKAVQDFAFPLIRRHVHLNMFKTTPFCAKTKEVIYLVGRDEIGVGLLKIPTSPKNSNYAPYFQDLENLNSFVFRKISEASSNKCRRIYLKMCRDGVLPVYSGFSLKTRFQIRLWKTFSIGRL